MAKLNNIEKNELRREAETGKYTDAQLAEMFNTSTSTVYRVRTAEEDFPVDESYMELLEENVKNKKQTQRQQDKNRIANKTFREYARIENAVSGFYEEFVRLLKENKPSEPTVQHHVENDSVGIIHLSDVHFNEQIELATNKYNFEVAARRLRKLVTHAMKSFEINGVSTVLLAMTGDMFNSDRRLDELLENATNRSSAVFIGFDIIRQIILDINKKFNVVVASVSGNEGRVGKDVGWCNDQALDNYDIVLHNMLRHSFADSKGVDVLNIYDPLECIVSIGPANVLLIHGHNGTANTKLVDQRMAQYKARYAAHGISIDYVLMGHIHQAFVSDTFARSGGLPGANAYSEKALNLESKASQNFYIIEEDGSIHGTKVDLQKYDNYEPYAFNSDVAMYNTCSDRKVKEQNGVVIHQIVI